MKVFASAKVTEIKEKTRAKCLSGYFKCKDGVKALVYISIINIKSDQITQNLTCIFAQHASSFKRLEENIAHDVLYKLQ